MTDWKRVTAETYDKSAKELAEYFRGIGPRMEDIDLAFKLAGHPPQARAFELGCGDGRDAKEIVARAAWYKGIDISEGLISLAKQSLPQASFEVADAVTYDYPENLDIVFAFASLLHLDQEELRTVLGKVHTALRPGGIFYISLKERPDYTSEIKEDKYGKRLFYFYNAQIISSMAGDMYATVAHSRKTIGTTDWFEVALKKL